MDESDYDFDDSPAGDVRRWCDVVSSQLERLQQRIQDGQSPSALTAYGETIVWQLVRVQERLRAGEMVDGQYIRQLLDVVMNSAASVFTSSGQASARSQGRAENTNIIGAAVETAPK